MLKSYRNGEVINESEKSNGGGGIVEAVEANTIATPITNGSHNVYISITSPFSLEDEEPSKVIGYINCKSDAECRELQEQIQQQLLTAGFIDCSQIKGFSPIGV